MEKIEQPLEEDNGAQLSSTDGSMLGKFKDATSLLNAYTHLQAEFTRKSQKLAELEKKVDADSLSQNQSALQNSNTENISASENKDCITSPDGTLSVSEQILQFVLENPEAKDYIEDMKQEIENKTQLLQIDGGMGIAFRLAQEKRKYTPAQLMEDAQVQQYILGDKNITTKIIDEYIKSLAQQKDIPKVMSGNSKAMVFSPNENQPQTLADANKIFSKMLEK